MTPLQRDPDQVDGPQDNLPPIVVFTLGIVCGMVTLAVFLTVLRIWVDQL